MYFRITLFFLFAAVRVWGQSNDSLVHALKASLPDESPAPIMPDDGGGRNQSYVIQGIVKDDGNGEGIPFANIYFPKSSIGTSADAEGNFKLIVPQLPGDTICFGAIGYKTVCKPVQRNRYEYGWYVELARSEWQLQDFVFKGGEDPALVLVKNIIARKPVNNPERTNNYSCEIYNKLEVDLERLTKAQFEKLPIPMMKKFSFIFDNLDTTSEATPFLPFYLTETISDYYFQRTPRRQKEFIRASLVKGIQNESITKFLGSMYLNVNVYNNVLPIFEQSYISPISDQALFYYKYKIKDTQQIYGRNVILVQFRPKRLGENCFTGDFWVVDSVFALQRVSLQVPKEANINWVERVNLFQEYEPIGDSVWFCIKNKFVASFTAPYLKLPGFIGRKTTSYRNILVNSPSVTQVIHDKRYKEDLIVADTARIACTEFWQQARHDSLSKNEKAIYKMIDTLESLPLFTRYKNMIKFVASGVKEWGPLEFGPYWYLYSSNPFEGSRFRFSMGTTPKLFKDVYLNGYVAYGTRDDSFKYGIRGLWLLDRKPRMFIYAAYTQDLDRSTSYNDAVSNDNIFANFVRKKDIPWKLAFVTERRLEFFKEYYSGFSHQITVLNKNFSPYAPLPSGEIFKDEEGVPSSQIQSSEISLRVRYAYKERFLEGNYLRVSLGSRYPIVDVRYTVGIRNFLGGGYDYRRLTMNVSDNIKMAHLGVLHLNIFAGKYYGTLPYPLLEIHPGNEFHYFNRNAFNMMNRFEFLSDRYAGIHIEHEIGGGVFNYIPILKKAKLRQLWTAKAVVGNLSDANRAYNFDKGYTFRTLKGDPYIELGTGVSNILQLFRLDFVWRVTPAIIQGESAMRYFTVFGSVDFDF